MSEMVERVARAICGMRRVLIRVFTATTYIGLATLVVGNIPGSKLGIHPMQVLFVVWLSSGAVTYLTRRT